MTIKTETTSIGIRNARLLALLSGASLLCCVQGAVAAQVLTEPNTIAEVVVTATGTEQNIQTVPIAVTVVNPTMLKQENISRPSELKYTIPSLTIAPSFNTLNNSFSVRGLAAGVTTYFAEGACCTGNASVPFLDIESIQVLNGPQGTLFGRTSGSGAILISPVRPNLNATGGELRLTGGNYGRLQFMGTANLPIIADKLAVRLAVNSNHVSGFTKHIGGGHRLDEENNQQARLSLRFKTGGFEDYLAAGIINLDQSASNEVLSASNTNGIALFNLSPAAGTAVLGGACTQAVTLGVATSVGACVTQRLGLLAAQKAALIAESARIAAGGKGAIRLQPAATGEQPEFLRLKDQNFLNVAQLDLGNLGAVNINIKNITSFEKITNNTASPADGIGGLAEQSGSFNTSGVGGNNIIFNKVVPMLGPYTKTFSNESKINVDTNEGLLIATVGYFYSHTELPATTLGTGNIYQIFGGVLNPLMNYNSAQGFQAGSFTEQTGIYGQATLDVSRFGVHGLKLTGGYRRSTDEQVDRRFAAVLNAQQGVFTPSATKTQTALKTDGYNYNLSATEQVNDDFMVYISQTRAYIPGGINVLVQNATSLPNYKPIYDPQIVLAREVGAKLDFRLGGMVGRINAAAYKYDFTNIAVGFSGFNGTTSIAYTANVAAAQLKGFEVYGNLIPIENWQVRAAYNYNDASYTNWTASDPHNAARPGDAICSSQSQPQTCLIDLTSNPFVRMPKNQGHVSVTYSPAIGDNYGRLNLSATVYAQSLVWFNSSAYRMMQVLPTAKPGISQKAYSVLNLRADWSDLMGSGVDAALFVNNATDKVYALAQTPQLLTLGFSVATYAPPRMIGIELAKRF
ncbi:MAG: TonB-dependent receptor [Alphaproteobacteria bacterium]